MIGLCRDVAQDHCPRSICRQLGILGFDLVRDNIPFYARPAMMIAAAKEWRFAAWRRRGLDWGSWGDWGGLRSGATRWFAAKEPWGESSTAARQGFVAARATSARSVEQLTVGGLNQLPPLAVVLIVGIAIVEGAEHFDCASVVLHDKNSTVSACGLGLRTCPPEGFKKLKEWRIVRAIPKILCLLRTERPLSADDSVHLVPCWVSSVEAVLRIANPAVIDMYLADNAPAVPLIIDRVFPLVAFTIVPRK